MRNLFEKGKFKWTYWGSGLIALGIMSQFVFGYYGWYKDVPMPKHIADYNFARHWGENCRYNNDLEEILIEIPISVITPLKTYSTSKAIVKAYEISKKVPDITLDFDTEKKPYSGKVMIHKDSTDIKLKIGHKGCADEFRSIPINWNKKKVVQNNAVKLKCSQIAAEEALAKSNY